ncbi:MAG: hypothetical protein BWY09_03075 [Candidatus Hydrogenedentes bacterium ADurb.Bin179]|nr:MAG: hypothetical protein BWY09_03075 [Candidatus Hydrogenedentes bacterium ADurb.Bin179]
MRSAAGAVKNVQETVAVLIRQVGNTAAVRRHLRHNRKGLMAGQLADIRAVVIGNINLLDVRSGEACKKDFRGANARHAVHLAYDLL